MILLHISFCNNLLRMLLMTEPWLSLEVSLCKFSSRLLRMLCCYKDVAKALIVNLVLDCQY
jgi:hypothetical protein